MKEQTKQMNEQTTEELNTEDSKSSTTKRQSTTKKPVIPKDVDPTQYVVVRNGFQGQIGRAHV